jgi:hypothetical protein
VKAGRKLDELIAEKVMGWKPASAEQQMLEGWPKKYSTDIAAAWKVLDKAFDVIPGMRSGFPAVIHWSDGWRVTMLNGDAEPMDLAFGGKLLLAIAPTAPHSICLAALRAVGVDVDQVIK